MNRENGEAMPRFCANLTMLFNEVEFMDRFEAAARAGFRGVEFLYPYQWPKEQLLEALNRNGLEQVLHNVPSGDWTGGERGIACLPGREAEFRDGVGLALEYATAIGCKQLNCLVGITPEGVDPDKLRQTLIENLQFAASALAGEGVRLLIEPLNSFDIPGFLLTSTRDTLALLDQAGHPNIQLQYDVYHMQKMEGNLIDTITSNIGRIAHFQVADNPGRHEPGTGEINYSNLFESIDGTGYTGWIGCEYVPHTTTAASLKWLEPYGIKGGN